MFRQGDLFDLFAADKRLGINGFHIIRNNNTPESGVGKRLVPDGSHILGDPDRCQTGTRTENVRFQRVQILWQRNTPQTLTAIKSPGTNAGNTVGKRDPSEIITTVKSSGADRL